MVPQPSSFPASFPGAAIRRATGTPFMGYAGAVYLLAGSLQRVVRCAFPHPAAGHRDGQRRRHAHDLRRDIPWDVDAQANWTASSAHPVLTRISAARTLRDAAEKTALDHGAERVVLEFVEACAVTRDAPPATEREGRMSDHTTSAMSTAHGAAKAATARRRPSSTSTSR
jgi:3,8-divinyl chlorophyllide a/chlorophyllide a reductase subunit Z